MRLTAATSELSNSESSRSRVLAWLALWFSLLLTSLLVLYLFHTRVYPLRWETVQLSSVSREQGNAYVALLPHSYWGHLGGSWAPQILENGKPLVSGSSSFEDIRQSGLGKYNFRGDYVSFSSSDNTDPRTNGREYEARGPLFVRSRFVVLLYLLTALGWVLALYFRESRHRIVTRATTAVSRVSWLAVRVVEYTRRLLNGPVAVTARGAGRCVKSLWLSAGILLGLLVLGVHQGVAASAISLSDPGTWQALLPVLAYEIGAMARDGHAIALVGAALLLFPAYVRAGLIGTVTSFGLTVLLFCAPLLALWTTGRSTGCTVGGLLPWSDCNGFYWDANNLLEGSGFSTFSARRPLFPGMLATVLGLSQHNLQVALMVIAVVVGISCFLAARVVAASHGASVGVAGLVVLFLFMREYIGLTSTESLGISLGAMASAMLWLGVHRRWMTVVWIGIFLLTLALNARAGAFFVLPALVLWGGLHYRGGARLSLRFVAGGSAAIVAGFLANLLLLRFVGSQDGVAFSNFSWTLYGMVVGGKGWGQVLVDHPELSSLAEPQLSRQIYVLALDAFRTNPWGLVVGSLNAYRDFFNPQALGMFSFVYAWDRSSEAVVTRLLLSALCGIGLLVLLRRRQDPTSSMMLAAVAGIFASVPLAPPVDADPMRAYAATIPFVGALAAMGLGAFLNGIRVQVPVVALENVDFPLAAASGIGLVLLCLLGPVAARAATPARDDLRQPVCKGNQDVLYVRFATGSFIQLVSDDSSPQSFVPRVRVSDFRRGLSDLDHYPELVRALRAIAPGKTILLGPNLGDPLWHGPGKFGQLIWLIADTDAVPPNSSVVGVCATPPASRWLRDYRFYQAESIVSAPAQ